MKNNFAATSLNLSSILIDNMLESMPASVYCKDKNGKYLTVNKFFLQTTGSVTESDIVKMTDYDLAWAEQAHPIIENDQETKSKACPKTYIEKAYCLGKLRQFLSYKIPLRNRFDKITGIFGVSFLIEDEKTICLLLKEAGFLVKPTKINHVDKSMQLTPRQADCLSGIARGMTIKQIAKMLGLSPKTVEHYLEAVKIKLNCFTRYELISKAIDLGYFKI